MDDFLEAVAMAAQGVPSVSVSVYATDYGGLRLYTLPDGSVLIRDPYEVLPSIDFARKSREARRIETRETNLAELVEASM